MSLPSVVKVGPINYAIIEDAGEGMLDGKLGLTDETRQRIHLAPNQGDDIKADTLIHEILHAALTQTAFRGNLESEEELCASLAPILLGVLRRNTKLVTYLLAG